MNAEIINQQKARKIPYAAVRRAVRTIVKNIPKAKKYKAVTIVFCDNRSIIALNKQFLKYKNPTDVIAFLPQVPGYLGEIAVSVEEAVRSCKKFATDWQSELLLYVVHGVLHLLGYDDTTATDRVRMYQKQDLILRELLNVQ